jgi:ABC-2 type transport system ATP-binding protein
VSDFAVSISHLTKVFGEKRAVDDLSLNIPTGSFFGLVGPNGAGKTTTLTMTTGVLTPDIGSISILGSDVWSDVNRAKRAIGVMPQAEQLFDRLTGSQLLVYSGMLRGMAREEALARSRDLLHAFDLAEAADTMVSDYSAGMTKKISLATAMIHSPRILFLDEPFESVDPVSSANLRDILLEYAQTGGTVIVSSHVMSLVEKMCTHVAVIDKGKVRAAGTIAEVAAGEDLEDRFLDLVGGRHQAVHLAWLNGGTEADEEA